MALVDTLVRPLIEKKVGALDLNYPIINTINLCSITSILAFHFYVSIFVSNLYDFGPLPSVSTILVGTHYTLHSTSYQQTLVDHRWMQGLFEYLWILEMGVCNPPMPLSLFCVGAVQNLLRNMYSCCILVFTSFIFSFCCHDCISRYMSQWFSKHWMFSSTF